MTSDHTADQKPLRTPRLRAGTWMTLAVSSAMLILALLDSAGLWTLARRNTGMILAGGTGLITLTILFSRAGPGTLPRSEGLMRLAVYISSVALSGACLDVWDAMTIRAFVVPAGLGLGLVALGMAIARFGLQGVAGTILTLAGFAWMAWLGASHVHDLNQLLALLALEGMGAIAITTGVTLIARSV